MSDEKRNEPGILNKTANAIGSGLKEFATRVYDATPNPENKTNKTVNELFEMQPSELEKYVNSAFGAGAKTQEQEQGY